MRRERLRADFVGLAFGLPIIAASSALPALRADDGVARSPAAIQSQEFEGLENVLMIGPDLMNGSAPEGEPGFESLGRMGIKTLMCVDGGAPDVERAAARGIRCVHLPIGYDGLESEQSLRLARAVRDLDKPIYIHCLHGKHRSPAAAGTVMVGLGRMTPDEAIGLLKAAGTSPKYKGLYESVRSAVPIEKTRLDAVSAAFPERAPLTSFVQSMVEIGHAFEHLEKLEEAGWIATPEHPDLDPTNEARILHRLLEQLQEADIQKADVPGGRPGAFMAGLTESTTAVSGLRVALSDQERERASQTLNRVRISCVSCHERFRD